MTPTANQSLTNKPSKLHPLDQAAQVVNAIIFYCLLAVIVLSIIPYGTVDAWWQAVVECSIFALTALWIFEVLLRGSWQIRRTSVLLPMIAITVFTFLQSLEWPPKFLAAANSSTPQRSLSIDHFQTLLTARKSLALTLFLCLLLQHTTSAKRLRWLVRTIIGVGLASALFGIVRQFVQPSDATGGFLLPFLFYGSGYGQFISPNAFAYLMEMSLGLLAGLVLGGGTPRNKLLIYLAIIIIMWAALVLSNSRGGLLSLACQALFVLFVSMNWYSLRKAQTGSEPTKWLTFMRNSILVRVLIIGAFLITLGIGVLWIGGESLVGKLASQNPMPKQQAQSADNRQAIWKASWRLFKRNPWTGVGFGTYFLAIPQYELSSGQIKLEQAHNDYLELAASAGVVGVALGIWLLGAIIMQARQSFQVRDPYQRAAALGAATGILGVSVHSLFDFGLQLTGIAIVLTSLVVVLVASSEKNSISSKRKV